MIGASIARGHNDQRSGSGGVILLLDEADALFGQGAEVRDNHDRHANVEVSCLLERDEASTRA